MDSSHQYGGQCILHMDVDSLFCQVEVLRNPWLRDIPLAIQQHEDVIAINYPAKQAGVKKHMKPKEVVAPAESHATFSVHSTTHCNFFKLAASLYSVILHSVLMRQQQSLKWCCSSCDVQLCMQNQAQCNQ
eukprot:GHRR01034633.1.p1 GENE.GHRR01034633.1~~GHRR01034633.1.p1  ORF type:complete len:131 (+),score=38.01 GHRR01034633.1:548-940(+)